jgi:hypothetical protein
VLAILGESDGKLRTAVFIMMMVFFTILTFALMYFYWKKSYEWRNKQHSHDMKFLDSDISMHAIMIKNLRTKISVSEMQVILKQTFEKLLPGPKVLHCKVLPKVDELYTMAK